MAKAKIGGKWYRGSSEELDRIRQENTKIPQGMRRAVYERYKADGFTNTDIARIHREAEAMREQMRRNQERREREGPRPITSGTYERAMRRTAREVEGWLTGGRGRGRGR